MAVSVLERTRERILGEERLVAAHIREGRFQRSLAIVAGLAGLLSGLEVAYEHYRGSYSQQVMYTPVLLSPLLLVSGIGAAFSRRAARTLLPLVSILTILDGCIGFIFHIRGIARKPGGWRIPVSNLIMGPPLFAPLLFGLSGYLGLVASFLRREDDPEVEAGIAGSISATGPGSAGLLPGLGRIRGDSPAQHIREGRFQKNIAFVAGVSAIFSGFESLYSHYQNDFAYRKLQLSPIVLAAALGTTGIGAVWSRTIARTVLPVVSLAAIVDGSIGFGFHARGVIRMPGGLGLPLYNVIYGPPIFAPLLFAASGFMGVLASLLRRAD